MFRALKLKRNPKMSNLHRPHSEGNPSASAVQITGANNNNSNAPKPQLPPLNESTMSEYWTERWKVNATNWRLGERQVGDSLFIKNLNGLLKQNLAFDTFADEKFRGIEVFVPLCGDSGILSFLFQCGFNVTGLDLAESALRNVMKESSSGLPDGFEVVWEEKIVEATNHKIFSGKLRNKKNCENDEKTSFLNSITLICGNFFNAPFGENKRFDIVYDRASFVAIPPDVRPLYAEKMRSILASSSSSSNENKRNLFCKIPDQEEEKKIGTAYFFSLMQRSKESKEKGQGPPFFFPVEELKKYYSEKLDEFVVNVVRFPTEEEAAATPGFFLEGIAHMYKFI